MCYNYECQIEKTLDKERDLQDMLSRIQVIHTRGILSDWEKGFAESLLEQLTKGKRSLSPRQIEIFERIEKNTSPEAQTKAVEWRTSYNNAMREKARIAAEYYLYSEGGYYGSLVQRIMSEPDFIPSEKQYRAMVENKYMAKVFIAIESVPKYPVGSFVDVRSNCGDYRAKHALSGQPAVVLSTNEPVTSAAKGAKRYKLLPIGSSKVVIAEERWIKKVKKMTSR